MKNTVNIFKPWTIATIGAPVNGEARDVTRGIMF